ncbi:type III secretion system protein [Proteus mirabilis]|uniref:Type III secretion system protein n=1 Tax=Proteus mirabilis TaxID=584 RepID=A0A2X2BRV6_PROMI|nr:type III secretion system protein [Proteus mirabilis]
MAIATIIPVNLTKELQDTSDDSLSTIMVNGIISSMQYEKKIQEKLTTLSQLGDAPKLYEFTNRT